MHWYISPFLFRQLVTDINPVYITIPHRNTERSDAGKLHRISSPPQRIFSCQPLFSLYAVQILEKRQTQYGSLRKGEAASVSFQIYLFNVVEGSQRKMLKEAPSMITRYIHCRPGKLRSYHLRVSHSGPQEHQCRPVCTSPLSPHKPTINHLLFTFKALGII